MRAFSTLTSLLALSSLVVLPRLAHAQSSCSADSECVKGWTCQVSGVTGCAAPACPPGEKCDTPPSDCTTTEFKSCRPAPCQADSDCADGMTCYTHTESSCPAIACAPGQACPDQVCEPKTESACVPRYLLPCTTANDCGGGGFTCESSEECSCSGGAPSSGGGSDSSASAGSASRPAPEESCTCQPSKEKHCDAKVVNCTADSDCTADWTCAVVASTSDCGSTPKTNPAPGAGAQAGAGAQSGAGAQAGAGSEDGSNAKGGASGATPTPPPDCRPSASIKQCVPPFYGLIGGIRGVNHDSAGTPTVGGGDPNTVGAIPPAGSGEKATDSDSKGDSTSSGGCSVGRGAGATGSTLALFGVLGLFSVLRRRRAG